MWHGSIAKLSFLYQIECNEEEEYWGYKHNYQTRPVARKFPNISDVNKQTLMRHNLLDATASLIRITLGKDLQT